VDIAEYNQAGTSLRDLSTFNVLRSSYWKKELVKLLRSDMPTWMVLVRGGNQPLLANRSNYQSRKPGNGVDIVPLDGIDNVVSPGYTGRDNSAISCSRCHLQMPCRFLDLSVGYAVGWTTSQARHEQPPNPPKNARPASAATTSAELACYRRFV
jgi:hypothetical protein